MSFFKNMGVGLATHNKRVTQEVQSYFNKHIDVLMHNGEAYVNSSQFSLPLPLTDDFYGDKDYVYGFENACIGFVMCIYKSHSISLIRKIYCPHLSTLQFFMKDNSLEEILDEFTTCVETSQK